MPTDPILRTSPKKARKPQWRTQVLWDAITAVADEYERMSVRQLYYQLVSRGYIEKTEAEYKRVCDASAQMRIASVIDVDQWKAAMEIEALERRTLESITRIHFEPGVVYGFKDDAA